MFKVKFEPSGIVCENACEGETVLGIAQKNGENLAADCGGTGVCGRCKIRIVQNLENTSPLTEKERKILSTEELENGIRLACMTRICGDLVVEIPSENRIYNQVVLSEGKIRKIELDSAVRAITITLPKPSLEDSRDDFSRLCHELNKLNAFDCKPEIDFVTLRNLPAAIKKGRRTVTAMVWKRKKIIGVFGKADVEPFGIAVDIGTTTLAAFLCNLITGETMQTASMMNPQVRYGDDVLARISHTMMNEGGLEEMQKILIEGIMSLTEEMCGKEGIDAAQIAEIVFAGNTVMQHIALGIPPDSIGVSPFAAAVCESMNVSARELGLRFMDGANVYCLPCEAGFVGADNAAVLIAEEPYTKNETELIVDIGTNSEVVFGNKDKLYITSCATGPALEGAQIKCGMRAANGAIEHIKIDTQTLEPCLKVIGGGVPIGICGSGIIDAVAQMALAKIIHPSGKFADDLQNRRIRRDSGGKLEYVLYFANSEAEHDIVVTAKDIRAVQLAKAALCTGAELIIEKSGMKAPQKIILAGAFGSFIDPQSVVDLGMLPVTSAERISVSGNAAGVGARYALLSLRKREEAEKTARQVIFVETAADKVFQMRFASAMKIGVRNKDG